MIRTTLVAATLALACSAAQAAPVTYAMDPSHTDVVTTWSHLGFSNPMAHFGDIEGTIVYDAADVSNSSVTATIPLTGLNSHREKLDEHLHSADLFDIAQFPDITFQSTKVEAAGEEKLRVTGDLTVRGITRPVVLDVTLNGEGPHPMTKRPAIGFDATTSVLRSNFGLGYGVPSVSDKVDIRITTEAMAPAPAPED